MAHHDRTQATRRPDEWLTRGRRLKDHPRLAAQGLRQSLRCEFLQDDYEIARELAADETGIELAAFPLVCPYTVDQVLQDWLP